MRTITATTGARAPETDDWRARRLGARSRLWWWLPIVLAVVYALALAPSLPAIIAHTWWSADSASAGFVAELYRHPAPGQYIILGNHGWYETLAFYLLTRTLPGHLALWYSVPIAVWAMTIALIGVSAGRAFGRYGAGLAVAALLCLAPGGLMVIFQPTAHTNVVFHAAALAVVAGWILPRIRTLALPVIIGSGVLIGGFTGLALAGDAIALVWAVLPFVVTAGVCAGRGSAGAATRTLAFALATLIAMLAVTVLLTGIMHGDGIRVDQLAQSMQAEFIAPSALGANIGQMLQELAYVVGGNFFGHRINGNGILELISGGTLLLGAAAVLFAVYRTARAGLRRFKADGAGVNPRLVHLVFWSTCLVGGLLMFVLSTIGSGDYRYLLGPVIAMAALLPACVALGNGWRVAVAAGLSLLALVGFVRLDTRPLPYLRMDTALGASDMPAVSGFAHRYHATVGYAFYWDAVEITWHTHFAVKLYAVTRCGPRHRVYCPLLHADSFTGAYLPRRGLRTLFVSDGRFAKSTPAPSWGQPIASQQIGRLTLYVYPYDIANRFPKPPPGDIREVITGQVRRPAPSTPTTARWNGLGS